MTMVDIVNINQDIESFKVVININNFNNSHTTTKIDGTYTCTLQGMQVWKEFNIDAHIESFNIDTDNKYINQCHVLTLKSQDMPLLCTVRVVVVSFERSSKY